MSKFKTVGVDRRGQKIRVRISQIESLCLDGCDSETVVKICMTSGAGWRIPTRGEKDALRLIDELVVLIDTMD